MSTIDLGQVERTVRAHLRRNGLGVEYRDRSNGEVLLLTPEAASAPATPTNPKRPATSLP